QTALAMGYSVTVSAAELLMKTLYERLFQKTPLPSAIRMARRELYNSKSRRAAFGRTIELEDWPLPVVYENRPQTIETREFTPEENREWLERRSQRYAYPHTHYGFF